MTQSPKHPTRTLGVRSKTSQDAFEMCWRESLTIVPGQTMHVSLQTTHCSWVGLKCSVLITWPIHNKMHASFFLFQCDMRRMPNLLVTTSSSATNFVQVMSLWLEISVGIKAKSPQCTWPRAHICAWLLIILWTLYHEGARLAVPHEDPTRALVCACMEWTHALFLFQYVMDGEGGVLHYHVTESANITAGSLVQTLGGLRRVCVHARTHVTAILLAKTRRRSRRARYSSDPRRQPRNKIHLSRRSSFPFALYSLFATCSWFALCCDRLVGFCNFIGIFIYPV